MALTAGDVRRNFLLAYEVGDVGGLPELRSCLVAGLEPQLLRHHGVRDRDSFGLHAEGANDAAFFIELLHVAVSAAVDAVALLLAVFSRNLEVEAVLILQVFDLLGSEAGP